MLSSPLHLHSSPPLLEVKSIDQLNSDLEAVKQAHKIDAEHWSVLLHSRWSGTILSSTKYRARGHGTQGQFKSTANRHREVFLPCLLEPHSRTVCGVNPVDGTKKKKNLMHLSI